MSLVTGDDLTAIGLSLRVAGVAVVAALPLALAAAWALSRSRLAARTVFDAAITLPLVLPPVATGYLLLVLFGREGPIGRLLALAGIDLGFRWTGAALAAAVMAFPLMVRPMRLAIEAIEPSVDEAGLTLGAGAWTRFFRLTLPLAAPGVIAGLVLGFAKALGEFGATITFVGAIPGETLTLPADIWQSTQTPGEESHTLALCLVAAAIAVTATLVSEIVARRVVSRAGL
ncbi:MAG TPA: molybdate ABC transporter permease subunit [Caulobacteraceae bacterium]